MSAERIICSCKIVTGSTVWCVRINDLQGNNKLLFQVTTQHFAWKRIAYQSSSVQMCCIAKRDVYASVVLYGFNVVYAYFSATFYFPVSYIGRWGYLIFTRVLNAIYLHSVQCGWCVWQDLLKIIFTSSFIWNPLLFCFWHFLMSENCMC